MVKFERSALGDFIWVYENGVMAGNIEHSGGKFTSNGVQVDNHAHGSVQSGGSWTKGTQ